MERYRRRPSFARAQRSFSSAGESIRALPAPLSAAPAVQREVWEGRDESGSEGEAPRRGAQLAEDL